MNDEKTPELTASDLNAIVGDGWRLLTEWEPLLEGDGFFHPEHRLWIDFICRPDMFRHENEHAHTWPWRRRLTANSPITRQTPPITTLSGGGLNDENDIRSD